MNRIEEQIKDNMRKAFFDIIDQTVNSDKPDYDWIVKLYTELRDRLLSFLRKDGKLYKELNESFDIPLFKQMIENDVFDLESMVKLVNNMFNWILKLQAPTRDTETSEAKSRVFNSEPTKMISTFLKEVHICIDKMEDDMLEYQKSINKD
jgi:hypothetical protein